MPKLTKRLVESLEPDPKRDFVVWDALLPGFGVRVWPTGRRVYLIQYRSAEQRSRKFTLGQHGPITLDEARHEARQRLAEVARGLDPAAQKNRRRRAPTMADLHERYMNEHAIPKKKPSSVRTDRTLWKVHILPALAKRKVEAITRADVSTLHTQVGKKTPGAANRMVAVLSKAFNLAEVWGWRPDGSNPCRHVKRFKERKLERYLSQDELIRLSEVLDEATVTGSEQPAVLDAIRLLLFTGCRVGEILGLRWEWVDFEGRCLRLPDSKTGSKMVLLNEPAVEVLRNAEVIPGNPWVIPGGKNGQHLVNIKDPWGRLRAQAGIEDVRLHDLRHTFASIGVSAGFSLPVIGRSLGHRNVATTARYAHLADDPVRAMVEQVGAVLDASFAASRAASEEAAEIPN